MNYSIGLLITDIEDKTNEIASETWNTGINRIDSWSFDYDNCTVNIKCEYGGTVNSMSEWSTFWIEVIEGYIQFESDERKLDKKEIEQINLLKL